MGSLGKQQNRARTFSQAWVTFLFEGICELLEGTQKICQKQTRTPDFHPGNESLLEHLLSFFFLNTLNEISS